MKILVLQLARLGDIYQSWPTLRALRRKYPTAEIDVLVRPRFEDALTGLDVYTQKILLPTPEVLEPMLKFPQDLDESYARLGTFMSFLRLRDYDFIFNLSFSPLSSFIVHGAQKNHTQVFGYSRHQDGYFNPIGEISAYFYAQVGSQKSNRFHLTELMATLAGVELDESDWQDPMNSNPTLNLPEKYVVIHVGASEGKKSLPAFKWVRIVSFFADHFPELPIVLIGSNAEGDLAEAIMKGQSTSPMINLVGQTEVSDLFPVIRKASLLVGCDSAPMHVAALTKTPCLNLSIGPVNFWETGPRSPRSFVFRAESVEEVVSEFIASRMKEIIDGKNPADLIHGVKGHPSFEVKEAPQARFRWELILAVYLGHAYPVTDNLQFFEGCEKLNQINDVILEQLEMVKRVGVDRLKPVLDRSDDIIRALGEVVPDLQVFIHWLKTERARVGPGDVQQVRAATILMHQRLKAMIKPYIYEESDIQKGGASG